MGYLVELYLESIAVSLVLGTFRNRSPPPPCKDAFSSESIVRSLFSPLRLRRVQYKIKRSVPGM